jgi:Tfp pilus assembly protein PilF
LPPAEIFPRAAAAARRAIAMEESLAEAHVSLAHVNTNYAWDWQGAEREFQRAIELNSEYGTAHMFYAFYLVGVGRLPEAVAEVRRAREVEPLSPIINANVGMILYYARQYEEAIHESRKAMERDPLFFRSHTVLGLAYAFQRRPTEATAEFERGLELSQRGLFELAFAGCGFAVMGRKERAQRLLQELIELSQKRYVAPYLMAKIYATLGERDQAFEYFERALQERYLVPGVVRDPAVDGIRSDPRFQSLLQRMGLPP